MSVNEIIYILTYHRKILFCQQYFQMAKKVYLTSDIDHLYLRLLEGISYAQIKTSQCLSQMHKHSLDTHSYPSTQEEMAGFRYLLPPLPLFLPPLREPLGRNYLASLYLNTVN